MPLVEAVVLPTVLQSSMWFCFIVYNFTVRLGYQYIYNDHLRGFDLSKQVNRWWWYDDTQSIIKKWSTDMTDSDIILMSNSTMKIVDYQEAYE